MLVKNCLRKLVTTFTAVAVLCVYTSVAFAQTKDVAGEITVTGQVTVNGQPAVSNATIVSGSTVVTGANSSAIVSLGKIGRVEVLADSNITLNFSDNGITAILSSGKAKVSNAAGVATSVTTKDTTIIADSGQADSFLVEVECSHSHVDTIAGMVTMREGASDKQIAAGTSASAGNLAQTGCQPCLRPNSAPPVPIGGWPWLLLIVAGVAGAVIFLPDNDNESGGGGVVISPTR
jgi:hypothetical protein